MKKNAFSIIVGSYALQNYTSIRDGVPGLVDHWGTGITGVITYTTSGWVSTVMGTSDPTLQPAKNLTYPPNAAQPDSEWAKIGRGSYSYSGPFTIKATSKTTGSIGHGPLVASSFPTSIGNTLNRNYTLVKIDGVWWLELSFGTENALSVIWWKQVA
ncbi:Lipocalin-like domain-containing protein [Cladorrhinum sp. PSN259]|nr:Lipocalin-like domain-containing protein [Cladorrhinum sp. PSN259]